MPVGEDDWLSQYERDLDQARKKVGYTYACELPGPGELKVALEVWEDESETFVVAEGGFNPYGNGQIVPVAFSVTSNVLPPANTNFTLFTAPTTANYDFANLLLMYNNVSTNITSLVWCLSKNVGLAPTAVGSTWVYGATAITAGIAQTGMSNFSVYLGSMSMTAGETLVFSCSRVSANPATVQGILGSVSSAMGLASNVNVVNTPSVNVLNTVNTNTTIDPASLPLSVSIDPFTLPLQVALDPTTLPLSVAIDPATLPLPVTGMSPAGVTDVNIVGFDTQDNAIWVNHVSPQLPVIYPPPPVLSSASNNLIAEDRVLEGSFNAYGNEQLDSARVRENDRLNPYADITYDFSDFSDRLTSACIDLPPASRDYARHIIDPEFDLTGFGVGYDANEDLSERKTIDKKLATEPAKGGGSKAIGDKKVDVLHRRGQDMARQREQVVQRVARKMKNWSDVLMWMTCGDAPDQVLSQSLYRACLKANISGRQTADYAAVELLVEGRREREVLICYGQYSTGLYSLQQSDYFAEWCDERFKSDNKSRVISESESPYSASAGLESVLNGDLEAIESRETKVEADMPNKSQTQVRVLSRSSFAGRGNSSLPAGKAIGGYDRRKEILTGSFNAYGNEQLDYDSRSEVKAGSFNPYGNGQPTPGAFPDSMSQLESGNITVNSLFETDGTVVGPLNDPVQDVIQQTGLMNVQGITMSAVPRETSIRAGVISAANAITPTNTLNCPEALLYPLQVRNGSGAALVDSTNRPATFGVGLIRRKALKPSVMSSMGIMLHSLVSGGGNIRPDQITDFGFLTSDSAMLLRLQPDNNGDDIVSLLVKSYLYERSRSWLNDPSLLPLGCEPGKFDSYTKLAVNPTVTLGFNNATVFNADCQVAGDNVFPYVGGVVPTIAFHVCKATIPDNEPWYMIKPGLLQQNDAGENSINIALLAMLLAPYPCGIHNVGISTTDDAGGNPQVQSFIPGSDLVNIPGITSTIHIYIPSLYPAGPPQTQAAANAQCLIRPQAGPTASAVPLNVAGGFLNVSFVGTVNRYNLANYLYTWMALPNSPIDIATLARFRRNVCETTSRFASLDFAWEMSCALSVRYPPLVASTGAAVQFGVNSGASVAVQNWFGLKPLQMTADYPLQQDSFDMYLPDMNAMWWCKISSGMYTPVADIDPITPRCYDGSTRALQYSIHAIREYAVTSEFIYTYMQQGSVVWNAAFAQLNFTSILAQIRGFFTAANPQGSDAMVSDNGHACALLHCRVNATRPASDMWGNTIWDYINAPKVGFASVLDSAGLELTSITPCILPDVWVQLNSEVKCLEFTPMLSTNKMLTGVVIPNGQVTPLAGGSYLSPMTIESQPRAIGLETIPRLHSETLFNARLTWHVFASNMYLLDGTIYAVGIPVSTATVSQKSVLPDWTVSNLLTPSILTANTRWMPYMTSDGLRIGVGVTAANGATLMTQIMGRRITTGVAAWLLHGVTAVPNAIVTAGGSNTQSRIARRPGNLNSSASSNQPSEEGLDGM